MSYLVERIQIEVKKRFSGEGTGHDWHHIDRVRNLALKMAVEEGAEPMTVELAALLHDIADHKFHDHDLTIGPELAKRMILDAGGEVKLAATIAEIVSETSYKGAGVATPVSSVESAVVQDADRLDAMGAIGIARAFAYGGSKHRLLHDPDRKPVLHEEFEAYARDEGTTLNHFHEKLLLLKDRMQTASGKRMAERRHSYMVGFIDEFLTEWEGKH